MVMDIWHYPRLELAQQVLGMFESGLSSALVFFAPRRMGKTEFLLKDMQPLAKKQGWQVLYFSFLDAGSRTKEAFTLALVEFSAATGTIKWEKFQRHIKKIEGGMVGIRAGVEFRGPRQTQTALKELIADLAKHHHKVLFLLDEVQSLSRDEKNRDFVATLRTALDVHKDIIKVIFTGSSREGLRRMFSKSDAPFFHFGQNLPFPELEHDFIDHLARVFNKTTCREINVEILWKIFLEMNKVPQLIRALVERVVLHPDLTLQQAKKQLLQDLVEDREYAMVWEKSSVLEQLLLEAIVMDKTELFGQDKRVYLAKQIGIEKLPVSTVQSAIRSLQRKNIIGSLPKRGAYYIDDPNFKSWIEHMIIEDKKK